MQYDVVEVTPAQMRRILTNFPKDQVIMLWGQVGIGKTSIIQDYASKDV